MHSDVLKAKLYLAGVNANIYGGTVDLLSGYSLNVDHPPLPVDCYYLAFSALHPQQRSATCPEQIVQ